MTKEGLYRFLRPILTFLIKIIFRPKIIGMDNICHDGKLIIAGNHTKFLDPVLLLSTSKRTIHFLAKSELVDGTFGFIFKHMGIIPVNRKIKDKSVLPTSSVYLKKEKIIGIFPEGTTEKGRGLLPFKIGAVKLAHENDSEIVPFGIAGKYKLFKNGLVLVFGKPYKVSGDLREENEKLRKKVIELIKEAEIYGQNK
ncbi:MAG: 1-acyl-sn-glycerol-3-phosphate acyltransferase [Bacilli bacterium]|nr:1-acyl-sn-glycerol-3-phosphate acyltransferase [Bacilli bacterium]